MNSNNILTTKQKTALFVLAALALFANGLFAQDADTAQTAQTAQQQADARHFPVRHAEAVAAHKAPARKITIPNVGRFRVLKGDFHIHTVYSDGTVMPQERVREAAANGLDVISITDHIGGDNRTSIALGPMGGDYDYDKSYELAKTEGDRRRLLVVRGAEISGPVWHFNALFLTNVNQIATVIDCTEQMLAASAAQGGFNMWNHPGWIDRDPGNPPFGRRDAEDPMRFFAEIEAWREQGLVHGIEVVNGATYYPAAHDWCEERDLAMIANTDIHGSDLHAYGHQNPARPMTLVLALRRDHDSVREAFFAKRTICWMAGGIYGRQPWVRNLFLACVEMDKTEDGLSLRNLSDIPCVIEAGGTAYELAPRGTLEIPATGKLTVANWFVGADKPLEINLQL